MVAVVLSQLTSTVVMRFSSPSRQNEWECGLPSTDTRCQRSCSTVTKALCKCAYLPKMKEPRCMANTSGTSTNGETFAMSVALRISDRRKTKRR